jgi:peptidoglycan/LPS O-acetylase OafA/YrhL
MKTAINTAMHEAMPMTHAPARAARADAGEAYYPWFDWLRGVLAATVMLAHDGVIGWPQAGNFAVQVFFALSGWLIGGVLLHTPRAGLPRFYFNRAVRIWVPYYIALALLLAASLLRDHAGLKWLEFVLYKATFVYNLFGTPQLAAHIAEMPLAGTGSHFWSVNTEEQFYLLAPLLLVLAAPTLGRARATWLLLALLAWAFDCCASIVLGVAAAVCASYDDGMFRRAPVRAALAAIGVAAAAGIAFGFGYERLAPIVAICTVLLLAVPGRRQALGAVVGGLSYPLYLNHWIGVFVANALTRPFGLRESALSQMLSVLINVALALALYLAIERPLLRRRAAWYTPAIGARATVAAYAMISAGLLLGAAFYLVNGSR